MRAPVRIVALLVCAALLAPPVARAEETVRCESNSGRYQYCRAWTDNRVRLTRQLSSTHCRMHDNWGYDRNGVWVDRGCRAEFSVGRGGRNTYRYDDDRDRDRHHGDDAAKAVAAVAGIAVIAALASQNKNRDQSEVSSWAVGNFSAYDETEGADLDIRILPGGSVTGSAGRHDFTGQLDGDRLQLGRYTFRIQRSGNGFTGTDVNNSRHRVTFRHSGSGY